ncbi:hypothetical protein [Herbiconiux sp. VKM Ac-2851]|uniref:hypothetical protein n=1 Tax=Herbiconiux sp. VKM Ac-2851 TaxID=2739025 RepID=UPI001565505A|nr:hypothetical protein [Herbiconiux sp. VKM Ac-2851]NQX34049.1 hypothetical protein [Herbiconiux sp. VKM Ac-2851]
MTDIQIESGTLYANRDERTVSGLLVPFGEEGNTNLGRFTVKAGAFTLPRDPSVVTLNTDHDRESPVGRAVLLAEREDGIHATFKFADTEEADAALEAFASGTRSKLSVEAKGIVLRAGQALAGRIFGAAVVAKGAFPSATLLAADAGEFPFESEADASAPLAPVDGDIAIQATEVPETVTVTAGDSNTTFTPNQETEEPAVALPNTLNAGAPVEVKERGLGLAEMNTLYAQRASGLLSDSDFAARIEGQNGATLFAALSDIRYDSTGGIAPAMTSAPQWLGEVWSATQYRQQILPLFAHKDLTGLTFSGFKWGVRPSGGDWAGNKSNVPSNTLTVSPVSGSAVRYAIGHDIAIEFAHFPVDGFFESYAAAVSEDYAKWSDAKVAAAAIAGATVLAGDALTTLPGGANGNIGSAASAIIDGIVALSATGTLPDFALVAPNLYKQLLKQPNNNILGYASAALGVTEGDLAGFTIRPSASVATGKVLVGAREAVTVFELPGAPIRLDALDLARGGTDKAAFAYLAVNVNDSAALQLVTAATV